MLLAYLTSCLVASVPALPVDGRALGRESLAVVASQDDSSAPVLAGAAIGSQVELPPVTLLDGKQLTLPEPGAKLQVVLFVTVDCPISNRYTSEYKRLISTFGRQKVSFAFAYVDLSASREEILKHRREFGLPGSAFVDSQHAVTRLLGATVTPEAVVLDAKGILRYRGRVNDRYLDHGKPRAEVRDDLRLALEALLNNKEPDLTDTGAVGCPIPREDQ